MFGRLVEKMMRSVKVSVEDSGYLSRFLDAACSKYAAKYETIIKRNDKDNIDALDVLAEIVLGEMGVEGTDISAMRAYLSILIENEHLPSQSQLSEAELSTLRDLLFCYFSGAENVNEKGADVLSLIEKKFANGDFSQARILLQIFETNNETRQNNERNLFYEEMIMRLDSVAGKSKPISAHLAQEVLADHAPDDDVLRGLAALDQNVGARFCLYLRDPDEVERWKQALSPLKPDVQEYLLDYIPVVRWRRIGSLAMPIHAQLTQHMTFEMLRRHVQQKLRMCYFILLASGNTGFEWFIFAFSEWSMRCFQVDTREVFPMLHRSGIVDGMCLQEALDVVTERFYGPAMNQIVIQPNDLENAYRDVLRFIFESDPSQIPPGHYNFGDFILDRLIEFKFEDPMFAYRLHSMM